MSLLFTLKQISHIALTLNFCLIVNSQKKKKINNNFFFYSIVKWNKLDANLPNSKAFLIFRNSLLKIGRPIQNSIYKIYNPLGIQFITRINVHLDITSKIV